MFPPSRHVTPQDENALVYSEGMDYFASSDEGSSLGSRSPLLCRLLQKHNKARELWADVASGDGRYATQMIENGCRVIAIDIDRGALTKTWHRAGTAGRPSLSLLQQNAATSISLSDKSVDGLLCVGFLHYFSPPVLTRIILEAHRLLKPHGVLLVELSTDVRRVDCSAPEQLVLRGHEYSTEEGTAVIGHALSGLFSSELSIEHVGPKRITIFGKPFLWESTDIYVEARKLSFLGA